MTQAKTFTKERSARRAIARRDLILVVIVTISSALLAAHFELNKRVFSLTRRWEHLQLDEWPIILFVLTLSLMWLAWRRYGEVMAEIDARRATETHLAEALANNRRLAQQHLQTQESEREHLARELHDELGQMRFMPSGPSKSGRAATSPRPAPQTFSSKPWRPPTLTLASTLPLTTSSVTAVPVSSLAIKTRRASRLTVSFSGSETPRMMRESLRVRRSTTPISFAYLGKTPKLTGTLSLALTT